MLEFVGWLLFSIVALIVLLLIMGNVWAKFITVGEYFDETHYFQTQDGWTLAIHRYKQPNKKFLEPIILCHGLGANRFNLDLEELSLARYLRDRGFETFVAELRGVGYSAKKSARARNKYNYGFDDYVDKDAPAIINKVLSITKAKRAIWIGHSMGGMIAYVAFAKPEVASKLACAVAIASPASFIHLKLVKKLFPKLKGLLAPFGVLHINVIHRIWLPFISFFPEPLSKALYRRENMSIKILKQAGAKLVTPLSRRLIFQFANWAVTGEFKDGERDYTKEIEANHTPFLLLASTADLLAPPHSVKLAYEKLASKDKTYICFGTEPGSIKYGHGDIVISERAKNEVYPIIAEWIEQRATPAKRLCDVAG